MLRNPAEVYIFIHLLHVIAKVFGVWTHYVHSIIPKTIIDRLRHWQSILWMRFAKHHSDYCSKRFQPHASDNGTYLCTKLIINSCRCPVTMNMGGHGPRQNTLHLSIFRFRLNKNTQNNHSFIHIIRFAFLRVTCGIAALPLQVWADWFHCHINSMAVIYEKSTYKMNFKWHRYPKSLIIVTKWKRRPVSALIVHLNS